MAGVPQIIDQIVQFTGATTSDWADVLVPVPDKMIVITDDGSVKRGNGTTLWVDLPILFNVDTIINYGTQLVGKANANHVHTMDSITGLTNALDSKVPAVVYAGDMETLLAAMQNKASHADLADAIANAVTNVNSPVAIALASKLDITTYDANMTTLEATISGKADRVNGVIVGPLLQNERTTSYDNGTASSGTVTIDTANGNVQRLQMQIGGNVTLGFTWPTTGDSIVLLRMINGGSGTLSIPNVQFLAGDGSFQSTPNAGLQATGTDLILFMHLSGTTYAKVIR